MTHRHIPGTDPLAPQPYSAAARADLVERTRRNQVAATSATGQFTRASSRAANRRRTMVRMFLDGGKLADIARDLGCYRAEIEDAIRRRFAALERGRK